MEFTVTTARGNEPKCPVCGVINELYNTVTATVLLQVHCIGPGLVVSREVLEAELVSFSTLEYDVSEIVCGACRTSFRRRPRITQRGEL